MTDKKKEKRSGFGGVFGMMKTMRKCMSGNKRGYGCAAMIEGCRPGAEGFDCSTMMKAMFGAEGTRSAEGTKSEEASVKA